MPTPPKAGTFTRLYNQQLKKTSIHSIPDQFRNQPVFGHSAVTTRARRCTMKPVMLILLITLLSAFAESTDLLISYKGDLKLIRNAGATKVSNISLENFPLDKKFGFPMALVYVENENQVLLSDLDNDAVDIYSISLDHHNEVKPVVKSTGTSQIESITYDPILRKLYWSDVFKYGVFRNSSRGSQVLHETGSMEPRSITMDPCHQSLYWSDRDTRNPKITAFDLKTKKVEAFKSSSGKTFYHGITFDTYDNGMWWFETDTDESSKSSCKIMRETKSGSPLYTSLDRCYPFSVTFDENFLYWNDWAMQAVMRLSKTDPLDLVVLFDTPTDGKNRAFGIANLNHTNHFNCDVALIREEEAAFRLVSVKDFLYAGKGVQYSDSPSQAKGLADPIFPGQATSMEKAKKMYNWLHQLELILICVGFVYSSIAIMMVYRMKFTKRAKGCRRSKTIDIEALPPFEVTKPLRKCKKFVPRIIAMPAVRNSSSIDIENCCQMTLCDQPCELAVNRAARLSTKSKIAEDKLRLLDDSMA